MAESRTGWRGEQKVCVAAWLLRRAEALCQKAWWNTEKKPEETVKGQLLPVRADKTPIMMNSICSHYKQQ